MKIKIYTVLYQMYLLPYVKITYDRKLNGKLEFILGWYKIQLAVEI